MTDRRLIDMYQYMSEQQRRDFDDRFAQIDLVDVAAILGANDKEAQATLKHDLREVMLLYPGSPRGKGPSRAQVVNELRALAKTARTLDERLNKLGVGVKLGLESYYEEYMSIDMDLEDALNRVGLSSFDIEMDALQEKSIRLAEVVDYTIASMSPAKRGRKPNETLYEFIEDMAAFAKRNVHSTMIAGVTWDPYREEYRSQFLRLLEAVLYPFDPARKEESASLGDAVRRAIGDRAKR